MRTGPFKIFLLFLFFLCIFLSFNKHSKDKANSYHGVIWADAAGYYVHLPIWFIYGNDASAFPDSIETKTGGGFHAGCNNQINTKYPCGPAILLSPFFLISHGLAPVMGYEADGFSQIYSSGIYIAGVFYCCMAIWLMFLFLKRHFSPTLSFFTPIILLISTNLFYYTIDAPAMSHVYSFFLFALFMYSVQKLIHAPKTIHYIFFALSFTLLVVTRPTSAVIILFPFFYEEGILISRIQYLIKNKLAVILSILLSVLLLLPQLFYWKTTSNSWIRYSYGDESFNNLLSPKLLETWFSPNNGLFVYAPILLLAILGIVLMIIKKQRTGWFLAFLFLLISYIFASWWCWWFGCSLGARSFVEFYALLCVPLAFAIQHLYKGKISRIALFLFIGLCSFVYFDIEYYYDGCFYGDDWDWQAFLKLLEL